MYIPKEAVEFSSDAWVHLGCEADGIVVHKDNPEFSSAHNCLLSKNGKKLLKICKNSDISKLTGAASNVINGTGNGNWSTTVLGNIAAADGAYGNAGRLFRQRLPL